MIKNSIYFLIVFYLGLPEMAWSQEKENDNLVTQQVTVVKSYNPSLSDVFQIKTTPEIPDSIGTQKQKVVYSILSVPVVETFEPNKASPLELIRTELEKPYNTIFGVGYGTKGQLYLDFSTSLTLDREQQVGFLLYRDGFGGNVNNTLLESRQSYLLLGLQHALKNTNFRGDSKLSFSRAAHNYFGLYNDQQWDALTLASVAPAINRNYLTLSSQWQWYDGVLQEMDFKADLTTDNFGSSEQKMNLIAKSAVPFLDGELAFLANATGVVNRFKEAYFTKNPLDFQTGKAGLEVTWKQIENDIKMRLGGGASYVFSERMSAASIQYYPRLELSYQPKGAKVFPFLKANGATTLANYSDFSILNPYLYPGMELQPLWQKYNARLGARSSQANVLSFELSVGYDQMENKALFKRLPYDSYHNQTPYRLSNAFEVHYVNLTQYDFRALFGFDFARENHLDFELHYFAFEAENGVTLWNLPQLKLSSNAQFNWSKLSLTVGAQMLGERTAARWPLYNNLTLDPNRLSGTEQLPLFLQSTFLLNYKIKEPFDIFLKGRFSNCTTHGQWGFYPEPNYLFLAGFSYKFNK